MSDMKLNEWQVKTAAYLIYGFDITVNNGPFNQNEHRNFLLDCYGKGITFTEDGGINLNPNTYRIRG